MKKIWVLGLALAVSAGPALAQGGGGRGFGFGGRGGSMVLVGMEAVQKELKLDQTQIELVGQLRMEQGQKMRALFQGGGGDREAMQAKMRELSAESDKKLAEILNPQQRTRLKQLGYRQRGARALEDKEVQVALKLTADQVQQVTAALAAERAAFQLGGFDFQNATDEQRREFFQKMQQMRTQTDGKLNAILTEPQKKQWESMLGAPFTFPEFRPGQRRQNNNA